MNVFKAQEILELNDNFTPEELKKNYRGLAMKYHPDKNKSETATDKFAEIQEAYTFLSKRNEVEVDHIFENIFKSFTTSFHFPQPPKVQKVSKTIILTAKEFLTGTTKTIKVPMNCTCQQKVCFFCMGSGFSLHLDSNSIGFCESCTGDGYTYCTHCINGIIQIKKEINIPPKIKLYNTPDVCMEIKVKFPYFLKENKLHCYFDITLKESLTGFSKKFKDPFGEEQTVNVNRIVKNNDGYRLNDIILVFKVIYPKKLLTQLQHIDF